MTKKRTLWEFKVYANEEAYNNSKAFHIEDGYSKASTIYNAKQIAKAYIKNYAMNGEKPIVKIQTDDREQIELYTASNTFGGIIFNKKK